MLTKYLHQRITFNNPFSELIVLDVFLLAIFFGIISLGYYLVMLRVGWCNLDICAVHKKGHDYFCHRISRLSNV